jgi:hypothetical protein
MVSLLSEAQAALSKITALFQAEYLPEAFLALQSLGKCYTEQQYPEMEWDSEELRVLRQDVVYANSCLAMLADFDAWEMVREEDDIAIFTKGSTNEFLIRSEMLMPHSAFSLLAVFSEVDLLPTWIDVIAGAEEVARPSTFRRINHFTMKLPWPLSNRDMVVACAGIPMPQNKSVLLLIRDVGDLPSFMGHTIPPPTQGNVRMKIHHCCVNVMQVAEAQTQVSFMFRADPKIALLPSEVRKWGSKQAIFAFMRSMREQCARFAGSEYERRVAKNPDYYNELRSRAAKYHYENVE